MELETGTMPLSYSYGGTRSTSAIQWIVIHYTGNDGDTAWGNVKYFANGNRRSAGAHYFVDALKIVSSVPVDRVAYHCGGGLQGSAGHAYHRRCTNSNSIGIEMCSYKGNDGKYHIRDATAKNALELTRYLMKKYSIPVTHVIRHFDVTGKNCPSPWIDGAHDVSEWLKFKKALEGGEEELTQEEFNRMAEVWVNSRGLEMPADESAEARDWAYKNGVLTEGAYRRPATREELVQALHKYDKQKG